MILVLNKKALRELTRLRLQPQDLLSLLDQLVLHKQFELLMLLFVLYYVLEHFLIVTIELYANSVQRHEQPEERLEIHLHL
jgi:hypothetical protein